MVQRCHGPVLASVQCKCVVVCFLLCIDLIDGYDCVFSSRLEVQAGELAKESAQRETGSLGAGSDCASTRGMAGSIISSYTLPDR